MITIRKGADRGHANFGWLDARYTFSFANYFHPERMGFRSLRVMNEDHINPGAGFPAHSHEDMEIITYVLEGELAHKDSTGGEGVIRPGVVQYMSAGSGVTHSEFNASTENPVHLYQIWLVPDAKGYAPRYEERKLVSEADEGFELIASDDGRDGSIPIHQDASLYAAKLGQGSNAEHRFSEGRYGWLQVARGGVELPQGSIMQAGDGAVIEGESRVALKALADSEVLLFDLA